VKIQVKFFWVVMLCSVAVRYQHFRGLLQFGKLFLLTKLFTKQRFCEEGTKIYVSRVVD